MSVIGAVLAGGKSTRMGRDKAEVPVGGATMLQRVATALGQAVGKVVVLGSHREGWECWPDMVHAQGPLAGIATALHRTDSDGVLVVAVDHPFVRSETLRHLADLADGLPVVPVDEHGTRQVTCALYPKTIATAAIEEAASGGSIQSLLDRVSFRPVTPAEWREWGEDGRSWYSADSPDALERGVQLYGEDL
ncbi:MAG: molybdenum cofactor guanylyltransferase [Acidimicrobiia bacterium]